MGWPTQSANWRGLKKKQTLLAQMLARRERDGWVMRVPDPKDERSRKIASTSKVEDGLPAEITVLVENNRVALDGFEEGEITQFRTILERMIANLYRIANYESKPGT